MSSISGNKHDCKVRFIRKWTSDMLTDNVHLHMDACVALSGMHACRRGNG